MKVFVIVNNYMPVKTHSGQGWYFLADSSVTNTGKPFYLPEFVGKTQVSLSGVIRISRLGKSIRKNFASRYYSEFAPALHFTLPEYCRILKEKGLPEDASRSFDRSLFVGDFMPLEHREFIDMKLNGEVSETFSFDNLYLKPDDILEKISVTNTLKMGDLVVPGLCEGVEIREGDIIEVCHGGSPMFHVKVK